MRKFLAAASVFAMLGAPAHAAEGDMQVFKPAGQWTADFGEDYCRLSRNFSDGTFQVTLAVERVQPGVFARFLMIGDGLTLYRGAKTVGYHFGPSGSDRKGALLRSETAEGKGYFNLDAVMFADLTLPPPPPGTIPVYNRTTEQEFAKGLNAIVFTDGFVKPVEFDTGGLKAPVEAMQVCADDLLKYWGLDPEKHKTMTKAVAPSGEASKWLPNGTIGFGDFAKLGGGTNQVRVMVSTEGKPTECKIQAASLADNTNKAICKAIMDKGAFNPALDADGKPMASYWMTSPFGLMPVPKGFKPGG